MSKILIVDDSTTMRKILMRVIRQAGIECDGFLEAANGQEGVEKLGSEAGIELVLSDVNMPVMNGIEFVKAVRDAGNATPIVMVTTEGGEAMLKTAMDSGASGYVTKPFTPDSIKAALLAIGR